MDETTTAPLPEHLTEERGWLCTGCDHAEQDEPESTLYECQDGGNFVSDEGNRCPECNKFASKVGPACPECEDAEMEEADVVYCVSCDETVPADDFEDHLHEDEQEEIAEDLAEEREEKTRRAALSNDSVPVSEEVALVDLKAGDWYVSEKSRVGAVEVSNDPEVTDGTLWVDHMGFAVDTRVQKVLRWERPTAAVEIKARDLTLLHVLLNPADFDPRARMAYTEIRTDLESGVLTCFNKYRSRTESAAIHHPDDTVTVVERDKDSLLGKPAFGVWWTTPVDRYARVEGDPFGHPTELGEKFFAALVEILGTTNTVGRKHYISATGGHRGVNDGKPYATFTERKPKMTTAFLELLRSLDLHPTTLIQTLTTR